MATQIVCRYNKFGHCKYCENCKFMHIMERCENVSCEIVNCKLRHPRICNYYRDYQRCKFGEWCSFNHEVYNEKDNKESIKVISERIEELSKIISEKDEIIKVLAAKIDDLEKYNKRTNETETTENVIDEDEVDMNTTFVNPYHGGFPCDICDFIAKSKGGLGIHMKSKHKEETILEDVIEILESESVELKNIKCEECEFIATSKLEIDNHVSEKHNAVESQETYEIKL